MTLFCKGSGHPVEIDDFDPNHRPHCGVCLTPSAPYDPAFHESANVRLAIVTHLNRVAEIARAGASQ